MPPCPHCLATFPRTSASKWSMLEIYPFGGAVPGKGRGSSFFKHLGENTSSSSARFANQFALCLWQGKSACKPLFSAFAFLAVGRCRLCSDCGLGSTVQAWRMPFFLAEFVVWKLAAAAAILAEFIAARSKWMSRRNSRRNRKCH